MQSGRTPQVKDYFADLDLPDVSDMELQLEELVQQGVLSPEEAKAELLGRSEMDNISVDPRFRQAQMDALVGLQDVSDGGLTDADMANLNRIETEEDSAARGKRDAILQNAEARGMGGSGLSIMSQLQNEQDAATRKSQRDMDVAAMASDRALQALIKGGELGGQMDQQAFNQGAQTAQANDAIAKFNAQNRQDVNMANVAAKNAAQEANLNAKQGIANQNAATRNDAQRFNKGLIQQNYDNEIKKRSGQAGIAQNNAAAAGADSQARANATNQMLGAGIGAGASIYGARRK